ncbi:hypothetical protein FRC04_003627 [Tulasnella sp. 424]|nr:hypothetical protein FRC04_003627 [Tulasnella sp. 424]KAG8965494.1 hypothetical protein FRC05_003227 [Tulasnella sp. 425]
MATRQLNQLVELLQFHPPPFIFIHDPLNSRPKPSSFLRDHLQNPASQSTPVLIDCSQYFTSKSFFHAIINEVTNWKPELDSKGKAVSWSNGHASKWDKSIDSFTEALKATYDEIIGSWKKGQGANLILLFENVESLNESLPTLVVPFTRLRELAQIPVTTIFISSAPWSEISPSVGTSSEAYMVSITSQSKQDVISHLGTLFPIAVPDSSTSGPISDAYDPVLKPLYFTFLGVLYDACTPYTTDSDDLEYLAYAFWPGFVRPVLEDWWAADQDRQDGSTEERETADGEPISRERPQIPQRTLPPDSATPLLIRQFVTGFQSSFSSLYSRSISATSFLRTQASQPSFRLSQRFSAPAMANINASLASSSQKTSSGLNDTTRRKDLGTSLSRQKKLLLVAAYISSFNPARTDLRMFGRVPDGVIKKGRARRAGGISTGKALFGRKAAKVPQVLLGPNSFTLERLLAIYGALLVEHGDGQTDPTDLQPGEAEVEVHRATVLTMLTEVTQLRLISRIGQHDRLDNNVMLKCNVGFEVAESFAKEMKFNLSDLLWDPVA